MKTNYLLTAVALLLISLTISESATAQGYEGTGVFGSGGGSNPLGNISLGSGTTVGTAVGTYTTSVDNGDGSYTLHHITTDAASNVVSHTTETYNGDGTVSEGRVVDSTGKKMGDVIGGGLGGGTENSFFSDPSRCLSIDCNDEGPMGGGFRDPYAWSFTSFSSGG